jgi:peptidoglycan/LPS O-acetylase OafA/YrhL
MGLTRAEAPAERGQTIEQAGERRSARVESLRAIAALAVLFGHVLGATFALDPAAVGTPDLNLSDRLLHIGVFGVFLFFGLTGYLIFWPFAKRDFGGGERVDFTRYAINRALRILPLYYVVVIVVLAFHDEATLGAWWRMLTFSENFFAYTAGNFLGPAWSLVVELHFYLLLPFLAWGVALVARGSKLLAAAILLVLAGVSLLFRYEDLLRSDIPPPVWSFNIHTAFLFFVPGMLLALLRIAWHEHKPGWVRGPLDRADLWFLAGFACWLPLVELDFRYDWLMAPASFLIVGSCVLPLRSGLSGGLLQWRPLAVLGVASYSLYLWHVPVIDTVVDLGVSPDLAPLVAVAVPASVLLALLSYRFVEAPFLRFRRQWSPSAAGQSEERRPDESDEPAAALERAT